MALTFEQQQALIRAKQQGLNKEQAFAQVFRPTSQQPQLNRFSDAGEDISTAFTAAQDDVKNRGENIAESYLAGKRGEQTPVETGLQMGAETVLGLTDLAFRGTQAAVKPFMSQREEEDLAQGIGGAVEKTGIPEKVEGLSDRTKRNLAVPLSLLEVFSPKLFKGKGKPKGDVSPSYEVQSIDEVVEQATQSLRKQSEDVNLSPRQREEAANAALSIQEKYIGMTPDVKKRLGEMGPEKLQEYLDTVHLRNIDDTAPTPYEYGSAVVTKAEEALYKTLNNTGSGIGQTRQKLASVQLSNPQVSAIEKAFVSELRALRLELRKGRVVKTPGTISPVEGGDVKALNALYQDLKAFKQSPTVERAIDLRKNFDGKIKFGKSARDVSNNVDGLSRGVRKSIAKEAAKTVGKQNAAELAKYSDFMDAYGDLQSFTNRAAGGEYLLRLVLSGRGGEARKLIQTVKEYTGIDLMNDATAMKIATEMLGNEQTRNLFRQEITKAGYDAGAVLSGSPTGLLSVIGKRLLEKGIDVEDILIKASQAGGAVFVANLLANEETADALMLGVVLAAARPALKADVVKALAKKVDDATVGDMQDFSRVIKERGTATNNKGEVKFNPIEGMDAKQVETAWSDGLRLLEIDEKTFGAMGNQSPGDIAKFFDEVIAQTENTKVKPKKKGKINLQAGHIGKQRELGSTLEQGRKSVSSDNLTTAFSDKGPLSTKLLGKLEGKTTVKKQFISDLTNSGDLKQAERDLIRDVLNDFDGKVNVSEFADKVKARLVPLERKFPASTEPDGSNQYARYENIALPDELRGNVANYREVIYDSPIKNSAGDVHFKNQPNYFAHSRIEDMADPAFNIPGLRTPDVPGDTRRVIEIQSDLFQKGRLEGEVTRLKGQSTPAEERLFELYNETGNNKGFKELIEKQNTRAEETLAPLQPYRNTFWERIIREEVRSAATDGKKKLQFPTGETAMKIEGLGEQTRFSTLPDADGVRKTLGADDLKVGMGVNNGDNWIITEVLDDGKFKAVPKREFDSMFDSLSDERYNSMLKTHKEKGGTESNFNYKEVPDPSDTDVLLQLQDIRGQEQFDISGKVDTKNPIYKFYEKDMQKYLNKNYGAKRVTDEQGVEWVEIDVDEKKAKLPVEAFGLALVAGGVASQQ